MCRVITAVFPGLVNLPVHISLMGDYECSVSAVRSTKVLDTWFGNSVDKIIGHMTDWQKKGITVDPLQHWMGPRNIPDRATKGKAGSRMCNLVVSGSRDCGSWSRKDSSGQLAGSL